MLEVLPENNLFANTIVTTNRIGKNIDSFFITFIFKLVAIYTFKSVPVHVGRIEKGGQRAPFTGQADIGYG